MSDSQLPTVLLTEHLDEDAATWLADQVNLIHCPLDQPSLLDEHLPHAAGLLIRTYTQVDQALLDRAPNLRVIARAGVGLDNVDLAAAAKRNITVLNTPDANTQAVVEYVWALIFDAYRPRTSMTSPVDTATFHEARRSNCAQYQVSDLTLGILGMGRIGRRVAQVAQAFGVKVISHDLLDASQLYLSDPVAATLASIEELCSSADILTIHIDGRPGNHQLVNADFLASIKSSCMLINTSRGMVVDATSLAHWLNTSHAAGGQAVLDVHDPEPPRKDYELWNVPNARLLPHLASRTAKAMSNMSWIVKDLVNALNKT